MIDEDVMQEALEHAEALNRAEEAMKNGARLGREAPAEDIQGIIKAAVMYRNLTVWLWSDMVQRQRDSMSVGEPRAEDKDTE